MATLVGILQNPVVGIIVIALAVAAPILAYVFYGKGRRLKGPSWAIRSNNLVREYTAKLPDLDIRYKGENVENLTMSRILFWNRGADTIRRTDIASADPLRVEAVGDIKLLNIELLETNNSASQFTATLAANQCSVLIEFEFLDRGQGAVLQVVHSGIRSKDISVVGTIMGAGTPRQQKIQVYEYLPLPTSREFDERLKPVTKRRLRSLIMSIPAIVMWILYIMYLTTAKEFGVAGWLFFGMAASYTVLPLAMYFRSGKVPVGLSSFEEII